MDEATNKLVQVLRSHKIDRTTAYIRFRAKHSKMVDTVYLPANPWQSLRMSAKEFFDMIFPERREVYPVPIKYKKIERKTLEDHFRFMATHKLYTEKLYINFVKKHREECKGYYQCPWVAFRMPIRDFFDKAFPERDTLLYCARIKKTEVDAFDHLRIIVANRLTSAKKYRQFYLANRLKMDLISRPWDRFGMSESEFFNAVKNSEKLTPKGLVTDEQYSSIGF